MEGENAERQRLAQLQQLDEEERDVVAALQKYSVMPRRLLADPEKTARLGDTDGLGSSGETETHTAVPPRAPSGTTPGAWGAETVTDKAAGDAAVESRYEQPFKGRFTRESLFLHEVGWILAKLPTSEYPSLETVSDWFGRDGEVQDASERALKTATQRWYDGRWPKAREAASKHYVSCVRGPSCVPLAVRK